MCTAVSYKTNHHYFGRNLDVDRQYQEKIVITPRNYPFVFRYLKTMTSHYAIIGIAAVISNYPLYFDAANEKGLSMAGLNFPENAVYYEYSEGKENIAPFELMPYLLGQCESVQAVKKQLEVVNVIQCDFCIDFPVTPLHWIISDKKESIVLECTKDGMKWYENPFGVLTNNPAFEYHRLNMNQYMGCDEGLSENRLSLQLPLKHDSLGYGALGLPGDFSSISRFVKTVFLKEKSICAENEKESVSQFFHILQAVAMPKGCVLTKEGTYEYTRYSSCCNCDTGVYYYRTYENMTTKSVNLYAADLNGSILIKNELN